LHEELGDEQAPHDETGALPPHDPHEEAGDVPSALPLHAHEWPPPAGCVEPVAGAPQPPEAGMTSSPPWWRECAPRAWFETVIVTYGFVADPVEWQIVVLPAGP
jgi:hypothetical protein